jgi:Polyketide cyclase / dehydrase and lipid transport
MTKNAQIPDSRILWPPEHSPASSRVFAQNTIDIAAAPETVWSLLIDCVKWPSWYKHCCDVSVLKGGPLLSANSQFRFKTLGFYFEPEIVTFMPVSRPVQRAGSIKSFAILGGLHHRYARV